MYLRQPRLCLFSCILEALVVTLALKLSELGIEGRFLAEERVTPNVCFQYGIYGCGIVPNDLFAQLVL